MFSLRDIFLLFIGAAVGFGIDRFKGMLDRRLARKQIHEELALNLRMLPHFRRYLEAALAAAQRDQLPNMRAIRFARASYDANYSLVLPLLSQAERSSFHIIYDHLAICNEISDGASQLFSAPHEEFNRRLRILSGMFHSLLTTVDKISEHISDHLKGRPRDALLQKESVDSTEA
jgi:hypothetical protein